MTPETTLAEFVQQVVTHHSAWSKEANRRTLKRAQERFGEFLGRAPTMADISESTIRPFSEHILATSGERVLNHTRWPIRFIWKLAYAQGIVSERPASFLKEESLTRTWDRLAAEPHDKASPKSLVHLYEDHFEPLRMRGKSKGTRNQYRMIIIRMYRFVGRTPVLPDLNDHTVADLLRHLTELGRSVATVNKAAKNLLCLWRFACRRGFVRVWPEVMRLSDPIRVPRAWTEAELDVLWQACRETKGKVAGIPAGAWWLALHHVLWWSGERIGALLQLRWSDFGDDGWLVIPAEFRKGGKADKATKLPPIAVQALEAIRKPKRDLIFPWDRCESMLWNHYKQILQRGGLASDRKSKFHRMRKSAASHYHALGGNAQLLCGHTNARVTESYLDPRIAKPPQAADLLFTPGEKQTPPSIVPFTQGEKGGAA